MDLGAVPFHMWIPGGAAGCPNSDYVDDWWRTQAGCFRDDHASSGGRNVAPGSDWQQMLMMLAVGSLLVGNLAAIAQTNVKRMLAFSDDFPNGFCIAGNNFWRGKW